VGRGKKGVGREVGREGEREEGREREKEREREREKDPTGSYSYLQVEYRPGKGRMDRENSCGAVNIGMGTEVTILC
jgi:hypothetical protein